MNGVEISYLKEDLRPPFVLNDVRGADFQHVKAQRAQDVPAFVLKNVGDFSTHQCYGVPDARLDRVEAKKL